MATSKRRAEKMIEERFNTIALRVQDTLAGLSDRDRKLLLGLTSSVVVALVVGGFYALTSTLDGVRSQVEYRQDALMRAQLMAAEFQSNEETASQIAEKLEEHKGANLSAFLEKTAQTVGIADNLDSVKATSTSVNGDLEETLYSAQLSKLSLEAATNFLYAVETSGFPLVIQSARFKTRRSKGERQIKLALDIAAYKPAKDGGEG